MNMKNVSNKEVSQKVITWNFPNEATVRSTTKKRNIMDIPMMPIKEKKKGKFHLNTPSVIGGAASIALMSTTSTVKIGSSGVFLPIFLENIFPLMLDIASVYVVIKIAMDFYKEQRGGGDSKDDLGLGTVMKNGKWLLLFYLIPFFIRLLEQLGMQMANKVGG